MHLVHSHLEQEQLFSKQFPQLHVVHSQLVHLQVFMTFKFKVHKGDSKTTKKIHYMLFFL